MELLEAKEYVVTELMDRLLYYCTPVNIDEEKAKFLKDEKYNPGLIYPAIEFKISKMRNYIKFLQKYKGRYEEIITNFGKRADRCMKLILVRASSEFTDVSKEIFGFPEKKVLEEAKRILEEVEPEDEGKCIYGSIQTAEKIRKEVEIYGWEIKREVISAKMMVAPSRKELVISTHRKFSDDEIERLLIHEVKTHIKRAVNDEQLPEKIQGCFDYLQTEEGLATYMEQKKNCLSNTTLRKYAARVLAVKAAHKSFSKLYSYLKGKGVEDAFDITLRCKRGIGDTSNSGGLTKDHIYLSGKMEVEEYLKKGELKDLFIGKIGVDDVEKVKEILE